MDSDGDSVSEEVAHPSKIRHSGRVAKREVEREAARKDINLASRLFTLPGELLNAIYEFCLEDSEVVMIHDPVLPEANPWQGKAPGRALTQTCRQLRQEFLPIYNKTSIIHVEAADVGAYTKTWLCEEAGGAIGTLLIEPHRGYTKRPFAYIPYSGRKCPDAAYYDLLPIVRLRRANTGFRFFIHNTTLCTEYMDWVRGRTDHTHPLFQHDAAFLENTISKLEIAAISFHDACIWFHIKPEYEYLWLPVNYDKTSYISHKWAHIPPALMWLLEVHGQPPYSSVNR